MTLAPLIDRTAEMAALDRAGQEAADGVPQLILVSGHRRVGKTFLLRHFIERVGNRDHRAVLFSATEQSEPVELARFAEALQPAFADEPLMTSGVSLGSWERALQALVAVARRTQVTVVIDEAPYLTRSTPGFASIVQTVWDQLDATSEPTRLTLILTGSAAHVMTQMVGANGPLRGRIDQHLRLRPFDLPTVHEMLGASPSASIEAYAACGGWPLHVTAWDPALPATDNLQELAGQPGGILLEDADQILQELPEGPGFRRVLTAIGRGRHRHSEIATDAAQRIEYPLNFLIDTGLVDREVPVGAPKRARPLYRIADPYLRFWFHLLHNERARIEAGMGPAVLQSRQGEWDRHLGHVFEAEARSHAQRLVASGYWDQSILVGRWWSTGRRPREVDVLGMAGGQTRLIGEARWSRTFDLRWVERLEQALADVPNPASDVTNAIWTRATPPADLDDVEVFSPDHMVANTP